MKERKKVSINVKSIEKTESLEGDLSVGVVATHEPGCPHADCKSFIVGDGSDETVMAAVHMLGVMQEQLASLHKTGEPVPPKDGIVMTLNEEDGLKLLKYLRVLPDQNRKN